MKRKPPELKIEASVGHGGFAKDQFTCQEFGEVHKGATKAIEPLLKPGEGCLWRCSRCRLEILIGRYMNGRTIISATEVSRLLNSGVFKIIPVPQFSLSPPTSRS